MSKQIKKYDELIDHIEKLIETSGDPFLIAIAGPPAAGQIYSCKADN